MSQVYAIGDIHGCCKTFRRLLFHELAIQKTDSIYCIGDYVDRGIDSKGVIDLIIDLRKQGYEVHALRGNHEQMMLDATAGPESLHLWLSNGGKETLKSFGISSISELPDAYVSFLEQTKLFISTDKYILVHAGLNFRRVDPFSDTDAMLWSRDEYFDPVKIGNRLLIHGHTPISLESVLAQLPGNNINIDGGCVYSYRKGYGNLVALTLPVMKLTYCKNIDD
jgi:serine/threonine protein phosphatase 1